jgi:hypothetical protein
MLRRLRNILSILSLLLALATAALWIRSYWYLDEMTWDYDRRAPNHRFLRQRFEIFSATGGLYMQLDRRDIDLKHYQLILTFDPDSAPTGLRYRYRSAFRPLALYEEPLNNLLSQGFAGFSYEEQTFPFVQMHPWRARILTIPFWSLILLLSLPGLLHFRHNLKRRLRRRRGLCPTCGYDTKSQLHHPCEV